MRRLFAILAAMLMLGGCEQAAAPAPAFNGTDITGATFARDFRLTDHHGKQRTLADFRGKVVVVLFGFTQCPDVCPTTLAEMAAVMQQLGANARDVQVLLVTVDPERDTQELLGQYVPAFHPDFLGLRGSPAEVAAMAKEFRIVYSKVPGKAPGEYTMDHLALSYVFDRDGKVRLFFRPGQGPAAIASDIRQLL